ncbi:MAG: porin family protein [Gammaproteobacteria bacterium]|nr:porin family protein [Gammaproteobacteria bacterium]
MNKSIITTTVLLFMLSAGSMVHAATGSSLNIKTGSFSINDKTQNIGGTTVTFDDSSDSVFSIEYESAFGKNFSWGVDVLNYSNDILAGSSANDASSLLIMGTVRKYFDVSKHVQPYIGGGVGTSVVTIVGSGSGIAFQGMAGIKFPFDSISAILEYKFISSEADDDYGASIDVSGSGIFAGIAINF